MYFGVPIALIIVVAVGIYTPPHNGISTSGTTTVAGKATQKKRKLLMWAMIFLTKKKL